MRGYGPGNVFEFSGYFWYLAILPNVRLVHSIALRITNILKILGMSRRKIFSWSRSRLGHAYCKVRLITEDRTSEVADFQAVLKQKRGWILDLTGGT